MLESRDETASFVSSKRSVRQFSKIGSDKNSEVAQQEVDEEMIALKKQLGSLEFEKYNKIKGYSSKKYPFKYKPKEVGEIYL